MKFEDTVGQVTIEKPLWTAGTLRVAPTIDPKAPVDAAAF